MPPRDQPTQTCRETYQGDTALAGLLAKHGAKMDVAGVRALLDGVLAAPAGEDPRVAVAGVRCAVRRVARAT